MCGLVGFAGNITNNVHEKVLKTLLILDSVRGEDSTGVAFIHKWQAETTVVKELGNPFELFEARRYDKAVVRGNKAIIGHNRYATSGGVTRATAHPFDFPTLVGVHNGTLINKHNLLDAGEFKVDSENLYHHIETKGLRSAMDVAEGAWALVWWDKVEETLNFLRNKERPLWTCMNEADDVLFWASEPWMLRAALNRFDIKHTDPTLIPVDQHISMHIDKDGKIFKPHLVEMKGKEPVYVQPRQIIKQVTPIRSESVGGGTGQVAVIGTTQEKQQQTAGKPYIEGYLTAKAVTFETLSECMDEAGAKYISCFDAKHPYLEVRLYAKKGAPAWQCIGAEIKGDISGFVQRGRGYYKVSPWSVVCPQVGETLYVNHRNEVMTKQEWEEEYINCDYCYSPLDADDENVFSTKGQCFCPTCASSKDVTDFCTLINVH